MLDRFLDTIIVRHLSALNSICLIAISDTIELTSSCNARCLNNSV